MSILVALAVFGAASFIAIVFAFRVDPEREQAIDALQRVVANESNHYDRYWSPPPEPITDEWLDATETKMREALTDAFCDDAAAIMLTLIGEIRRRPTMMNATSLQRIADVLSKEAEYERAMTHRCPICGADKGVPCRSLRGGGERPEPHWYRAESEINQLAGKAET